MQRISVAAKHAALMFACAVVLIPIAFLVLGAFKSTSEFFQQPFALPQHWSFSNFTDAWDEASIGHLLVNSTAVAVVAVGCSTVLGVSAAYGIAWFRFVGQTGLRLAFVAGLMVPTQLIALPLLILYRNVGLLDTLVPLMITYTVFALPLVILIMVDVIATIPREIADAAFLDGASPRRVLIDIVVPLARPGIVAVVVLNATWIWNDFFLPLLFSGDARTFTLPLGILEFYGTYSTEWGLIFASVLMSVVPILVVYLFAFSKIVGNLSSGAVKG